MLRFLLLLLFLLTSVAYAQQPVDANAVERRYIEQELLTAMRDKAKIVGIWMTERSKLCGLIEEGKRPDECKQ